MKRYKNYILSGFSVLLITGFLFFSQNLFAQSHLSASYDFSFTNGNTREYIQKASVRGWSLEFGYYFTEKFSLGVKLGLHSFYEELAKDTYTNDNVTIYGKQFRYINSFPTLVTAQYDIIEGQRLKPYIKLGLGGYYFQKRTEMGLFTYASQYEWNFGFQPEAGILFPLNEKIMFNLNARFNQILANQSLDEQSYFNIGLGVVFTDLGRRN